MARERNRGPDATRNGQVAQGDSERASVGEKEAGLAGKLLGGEETVTGAAGANGDANRAIAAGAVTLVSRVIVIDVDTGVDVAAGEMDADEPARFAGFLGIWRVGMAGKIEKVAWHGSDSPAPQLSHAPGFAG